MQLRLFAVRLIKDKQAVGFFWAPDPHTLWWMVDSVCDPGLCESRRISDRAAITWEGKVKAGLGTGVSFDDETGESEELNELREGLGFEYALEDYIFGEIADGWVKLPYVDEPGGGFEDIREEIEAENKKKKRKKTKQRKSRI